MSAEAPARATARTRAGGAVTEPASPALTILAEVALLLVDLAAFATFARVFVDDAWRTPVLTALVAAHVVGALGRRARLPVLVMAPVSAIGVVLTTSLSHYRPTLRGGLVPTGATRTALDADLSAAWGLFGEIGTPTASTVGFAVMIGAAAWVAAFLADWAAFRLWSAFEAAVPALAVVIFVAFFAGPEDRLLATGRFVVALLLFLLAHRVARQSRTARWLANGERAGTLAVLRAGAALALLATVLGVTIGPRVPGAEEEALIDVTGVGESDPSRFVVSPLVDIRGRLVNQTDQVAFTVRTDTRSYYRLAGLSDFDGSTWGSRTSYEEADGPLPSEMPATTAVETVRQEFTIVGLRQVWVPGAFEPRVLEEANTEDIRYDSASGTLIVGRDLDDSDGLRYTLLSAIPRFDRAVLAADQPVTDPEFVEQFTSLPGDFSPTARTLARELTTGLTSPYDQALALQNYFRDNFEYSLEVAEGHGNRRVERFLEERVGYCEQFAGTFAAMARSIGLPARVAVGFTWGEQDPVDPTLYRVRGKHAHAWPEVYFNEVGWVAFEPTPGRGAPGASAWTDVPPAQADEIAAADPVVPTPAANAGATPPPRLPDEQLAVPGAAAPSEDGGVPGWLWVPLVPVLAAAAAGGWLGLMAALRRRRAHRRRARAGDDARRLVGVAWDEALDALRPLDVAEARTETPQEFAARVSIEKGLRGPELRDLGRAMTAATYGARPPAPAAVDAAQSCAERLHQEAQHRLTPLERLRDLADPRALLSRR
jgi:transglutaminase-like putative cysteine protease